MAMKELNVPNATPPFYALALPPPLNLCLQLQLLLQ
jgi:hypothetical protein